jgi:ATP/maltotriose-dependent transcriptional regulator MalT
VAHRGTRPPLVRAKLSPPQVSGACLRPQTLERLERSFQCRVTLVCAPAGYGKTTVVLEALRRLRVRSIWYKLDVLDQDPVALIASLVEALAGHCPGFGQTILDRLANAHDVPYPIEQMAAEFVVEATETVTADIHFILDDYHEAADSRSLNSTLDFLVANLPASMRLVVLSRYEPAFGIGKLRLDGQLGMVGVEELRFGPDEVREVVANRAGTSLSPERATALAELTEGWPASIVLAALAARWVGVETLEDALGDPRLQQDVFSYLAEQVYSRETNEVKAFLRRTCCLEYVSADLAKGVGAPRKAHRILAHLLANGVFTFATAQEGTCRYHSLFREFLRQKAIQEDGPDRYHKLQVATAAALEAHGDVERAVDLCLAANEPRLGLATVARAGETNLDAFRSDTLEAWVERLPDDIRHAEPWAQLIAGEVDMRSGSFDEALRHDANAIDALERSEDRQGLYHALSAVERTLFWKGNTTEAADACRRALEVAVDDRQRVHTLISLGAALNAECRWEEATKALDGARRLAASSLPAEQARIAAYTAYIASNTGRYRVAARAVDDASATVSKHGSPSLRMAFLNLAGATHLFMAEWARAREALEAARQLGERYGFIFLQALVDDAEGQLFSAMGEHARSDAASRVAINAPATADDPYCLSMALCHAGTAARRSGGIDAAVQRYIDAASTASGTSAQNAFLNASANLVFAQRLVTRTATSEQQLSEIARQARDLDLLFVALKADFFAAALIYRDGRHGEALERLATCIPLQLELGHLNFLVQELVLEPEMASDILHHADDPTTVESLLDLLARHWNGMRLIVTALTLDPVSGVAATRAAVAHRSEPEIASVLARATRSPFAEVRKVAAALRRERRGSRDGDQAKRLDLTPRETQIMQLIAEGLTNDEVAHRLFISPATVKTHVNHIFTKLGARDRVRAVLAFREAITSDQGPPS